MTGSADQTGRRRESAEAGVLGVLAGPGPQTIERLLEAWYGPPRLEPQPVPPGASPLDVRDLAAVVARWPRAFRCNHLEVDGPLIGGRFRRFLYEAQSAFEWAVEEAVPTGAVWCREADSDEWLREREPLARFLVQAVVFEAVMDIGWGDEGHFERPPGYLASRFVPDAGARFIAGASVTSADLRAADAVLAGLQPIPLGTWLWPTEPTTFLAGADAIAVRIPSGGGFDVFLASRRPESVARLQGIPGLRAAVLAEQDPEAELEEAEAELRRVQADAWRRRGVLRRLPQDPFSKNIRRDLGPPVHQ